mmetsp:Transcript_24098/g.27799  ORF Transcript_24098/g.27799 Transcript_24098/m.27799 type:complete len:153 (+) Transcript_24098:28-486(+)
MQTSDSSMRKLNSFGRTFDLDSETIFKSKCDQDDDISDLKTLEAIEILRKKDFDFNFSGMKNRENVNNSNSEEKAKYDSCKTTQSPLSSSSGANLLKLGNIPQYDPHQDYYNLYWATFIENQALLSELKAKLSERNLHLSQAMNKADEYNLP